jgi:transcriptional regulator with XRE-family HTH domain
MPFEKQAVSDAFGVVLRQFRTRADLSQVDLADRAEVHVNTISLLERGRRGPALDLVLTLAEALEVGPDELVLRTQNRVDRNGEEGGQ